LRWIIYDGNLDSSLKCGTVIGLPSMWQSRVRLAAAVTVGAVALAAGLVSAAPLFGGGVQGTVAAIFFALIVFVVALVAPVGRRTDQVVALPPATLPDRPSDFGFLKWWEFRRALNRAREVTLAEAQGEVLDGIRDRLRGEQGPQFREAEIVRRLEAREREVYERFGFHAKK
jgi:hypothetical protein